jgi:hypothetical protein
MKNLKQFKKKINVTSGGGIVGAKLCFLLNILVRRLSGFDFLLQQQQNNVLHIREQQLLSGCTIKVAKMNKRLSYVNVQGYN